MAWGHNGAYQSLITGFSAFCALQGPSQGQILVKGLEM